MTPLETVQSLSEVIGLESIITYEKLIDDDNWVIDVVYELSKELNITLAGFVSKSDGGVFFESGLFINGIRVKKDENRDVFWSTISDEK